jgi:octaprenyl-diphosphate synthase
LGDFLFTRAYALAATCRSAKPARSIATASTKLCEGELRQQLSAGNWRLKRREYLSIIGQKTAALCTAGCRLGAWQAGATPDHQRQLAQYGQLLGLAFQIYDDWLDYWGDNGVGKTLGTDLVQLKPTLPLIEFLGCSTRAERNQFIRLVAQPTPETMELARRLICNSQAGPATLYLAHRLADKAIGILDNLSDSAAKRLLQSLALFSVQRNA